MIAISCVLFFLQALGIFGSFANDLQNNQAIGTKLTSMFRAPTDTMDFIETISLILGYFLPTVIGVILIAIAHKRRIKQNGQYKEPKRRSWLGFVVFLLSLFYTLIVFLSVDQMDASTYWGAYFARVYQKYRVYVLISSLLCAIGFFLRIKACYLMAAGSLVISLILYSRDISEPVIPGILAIFMVVVFVIDNSKQRKQQQELSEPMD